MTVHVLVAWWIACVLWSSTYVFIKIGLGDVPPWTFAWVRLLIAVLVWVPIGLRRGDLQRVRAGDARRIMAAGVLLLGVNYGLLYWGARLIPSGLTAILQSVTPVVALAIAWLLGAEVVTRRKVISLATGVFGVALIFGFEARVSGMAALAGTVAVFGSSVCVALAYVWLKSSRTLASPIAVTTLQCIAGFLVLAVPVLALEGEPSSAAWSRSSIGAVLYLALCGSVVAFWLNYWLLQRMDASAMLMMGVVEVPIALMLGAALLGERLPAGTLLGAACVLASVVFGPMATPSSRGAGGS